MPNACCIGPKHIDFYPLNFRRIARMRVPKFPFCFRRSGRVVFDVFLTPWLGFVCVRIASPRGLLYDPNMIQICLRNKVSDISYPRADEFRNNHARANPAITP